MNYHRPCGIPQAHTLPLLLPSFRSQMWNRVFFGIMKSYHIRPVNICQVRIGHQMTIVWYKLKLFEIVRSVGKMHVSFRSFQVDVITRVRDWIGKIRNSCIKEIKTRGLTLIPHSFFFCST